MPVFKALSLGKSKTPLVQQLKGMSQDRFTQVKTTSGQWVFLRANPVFPPYSMITFLILAVMGSLLKGMSSVA